MATDGGFRWKKWLLLLVIAGAAGGAAYWYFLGRDNDAPQYQTTPVTRGDVIQAVTATGQLNPVTNVTVGSQISGNILRLFADFNSPVKAGQVVAQLDPATYKAAVDSAQGDLANARANLELMQVEANRATELKNSNLVSQSDFDKAIADLHQAQAQVQIKQAALDRANVDLSRCTIYAPVDGIVISRSVDVGQTVAASLSAPTLFIIANDLAQMQIDANVAEADVGSVGVGQEVSFTVDAFPNRTFHGEVRQVRNAPITVQNVVSYDTVITVNNSDLKLKPGMTANVSIIIAEHQDILRIPNSALRIRLPEAPGAEKPTNAAPAIAATAAAPDNRAGGSGRRGGGRSGGQRGERQTTRTVHLLSGNDPEEKPRSVQIKTGITDGVMTEVTEGLSEGDRVITSVAVQADAPAGSAGGNPMREFRRMR